MPSASPHACSVLRDKDDTPALHFFNERCTVALPNKRAKADKSAGMRARRHFEKLAIVVFVPWMLMAVSAVCTVYDHRRAAWTGYAEQNYRVCQENYRGPATPGAWLGDCDGKRAADEVLEGSVTGKAKMGVWLDLAMWVASYLVICCLLRSVVYAGQWLFGGFRRGAPVIVRRDTAYYDVLSDL
jgi:hypothetical protein